MAGSDAATVLVVEDEEELAQMYAQWLDDYDVRTTYTGEDAVDVLDDGVDVVLLDRRLPGMKGSEVLERVRDRGYECRVAMITAVDPDFDIADMAFDDYIVKPVLEAELRELVDKLLTRESYDEKVQESFSLASKIAALERAKTRSELEESDEYARLRTRFEALEDQIDETLEGFDDEDYLDLYRDLS